MSIHVFSNDDGSWLSSWYFKIKHAVKKSVQTHPDLQSLIQEEKPNIKFLSDIFLFKDGRALTIFKSKSERLNFGHDDMILE